MNVDKIIRTVIKNAGAIFIWLFAVASTIVAAETNKFTVEETIKDMKPASFSCEVSPDGNVLDTAGATAVEPDMSCSLSAEKLVLMLEDKKNIVLVDTRRNKAFASFSIPGAINLTASEVRRKSFLRKKTVVLIGNGKVEKAHYVSCATLKNNNFPDVKVLKGGMLAWVAKHLSINGKADLRQMGVLSSLELWAESKFPANLIVIDSAQAVFKQDLGAGFVMDTITAQGLKKEIKKRQKNQKKSFISSVIVVAPENSGSQLFTKLREDMFPVPVLIYAGANKKYKAQLKLHEAVMLAKSQGPKKPGCHL